MATMQFGFAGRVAVLRHTKEGPSDAEWAPWVEALEKHKQEHGDHIRVLIWTEGGSPTPSQRAKLKAFESAHGGLLAAVVSNRIAVRFIVSAIALFDHDIRAFAPDETDAAFAHLGLTATERADANRTLEALGEKLGGAARKG